MPCHPQNQLAACTRALESSEELLETANQTLQAADSKDFPQVGALAARENTGRPVKLASHVNHEYCWRISLAHAIVSISVSQRLHGTHL